MHELLPTRAEVVKGLLSPGEDYRGGRLYAMKLDGGDVPPQAADCLPPREASRIRQVRLLSMIVKLLALTNEVPYDKSLNVTDEDGTFRASQIIAGRVFRDQVSSCIIQSASMLNEPQ